MRSLLIRSVGLVGLLEHESTDHFEGIAPVPFRVRPEPRRPGWDYRSPIFAEGPTPDFGLIATTRVESCLWRTIGRK